MADNIWPFELYEGGRYPKAIIVASSYLKGTRYYHDVYNKGKNEDTTTPEILVGLIWIRSI